MGEANAYKVQKNDTLSAIANANGTTVAGILRLNKVSDPDLIVPGDEIVLPNEENRIAISPKQYRMLQKKFDAGYSETEYNQFLSEIALMAGESSCSDTLYTLLYGSTYQHFPPP